MSKNDNKNKKIVLMISFIGIALVFVGLAYSFVLFVFQGHREQTIDLKGISFSYEEQDSGLSLTKLTPMSDVEGLASGNDYIFSVSATSRTSKDVPYHIYLTIDNENTLKNEFVRLSITNTTLNKTEGPINVSNLEIKENNNYYLLEDTFSFDGSTTTLSNMYKLTIWINEDYEKNLSYSSNNNEQITIIGGETFNFKISVAAGK